MVFTRTSSFQPSVVSTLTNLREQTFDGLSPDKFVESVWKIPRDTITRVLSTPCALDPGCLRRYNESYNSPSEYWSPFEQYHDLVCTLLSDIKAALGETVTSNRFSCRDKALKQSILTVHAIAILENPNVIYDDRLQRKICSCCSCALRAPSQQVFTSHDREKNPSYDEPQLPESALAAFTDGEQFLVSEASLAMAASSRFYITGIHVDFTTARLWYFDRSCIIRSAPFDFIQSPQTLALVMYAVSRNHSGLGFDPHLVLSSTHFTSNSERIQQLKGTDIFFPPIFKGDAGTRFTIIQEALVYSSPRLLGRGTTVYAVSTTSVEWCAERLALKCSWPANSSRSQESDILLRLWHCLPQCRHYIPQVVYHDVYTAGELELPRVDLLCDDLSDFYVDRHLAVLVTPMYQHLWEVDNVQEFMKAFIDCIICHHYAYRTARILHCDISENNLMGHRTSSGFNGVLNDWDMAGFVNHKGVVPVDPNSNHPTGTLPFMAIDLLRTPTDPPPHRYEYDLESFFYILVWASLHFDLNKKVRRSTLPVATQWQGPMISAAVEKRAFLYSERRLDEWRAEVLPEFQGLWNYWILPFRGLLADRSPGFEEIMAVLQPWP